jgi:hypothetical protein
MKFSSLSLSLFSSFPLLISSIQAQNLSVNAVNLVGWEGCSVGMKKKIAASWEDAVNIGQSFVDTKINWNEAAALEYLAPPGFNEGVRTQIEDVLENVATFGQGSWFWHPTPLKWKIFVRCDDWKSRCRSQPAVAYTDNFIGSPTGSKPRGNDARSKADVTVMNFCPTFDLLPSLSEVIAENKKFTKETQLNLDNYRGNRGKIYNALHLQYHGISNSYSICDIP